MTVVRRSRDTGKYAFFAIVSAMTAFVLWNNERFFLNPNAPEWAHFSPIKWHLIPHGIGGTLALALGRHSFRRGCAARDQTSIVFSESSTWAARSSPVRWRSRWRS